MHNRLREDRLHILECGEVSPLTAYSPLAGQPYILHRILRGFVGGKPNKVNDLLRVRTLRAMQVDQIVVHQMGGMIGGAIPHHDQATSLKDLAKIFQKGRRVFFASPVGFPENRPSGQQIAGPIVRLPGPNIFDRHHDALSARSPHIATGIAPQQMTFIHHQHDGLLHNDGGSFLDRFF